MIMSGEYRNNSEIYNVVIEKDKLNIQIALISQGQIVQAFKREGEDEYSFANVQAKNIDRLIRDGLKGCNSKNGQPIFFPLGTSILHTFIRLKVEYEIEKYNDELVGANIRTNDEEWLKVNYREDIQSFKFPTIPYIKLTKSNRGRKKKKDEDLVSSESNFDNIQVRTVAEIALEKDDVTWLKGKKYYIINDDAQAEEMFSQLDNYTGPIAFDTETTGLKINCFGKINSVYKRNLEKYNEEHPTEQIKADRLVGIIFCVQEDVSYYFPAFNRKFKNLYQDLNSEVRRKTIEKIKAKYTVGELREQHDDDMYDYVIKTPAEEFTSDVILMERVRDILSKGHMVGHNATFDWKVAYLYGIDTNFKDDTMIMHQLMYKFRSTTSNRGESSALKYLEKREFGMDAWELEDFFPDYKEDDSGLTRSNKRTKKESTIDFSYMDYDGTRIYAPTDGDGTFKLFVKYKSDMIENHKDLEYLYQVEMLVSSAVGYMEFYGHRLDERMIEGAKVSTKADVLRLESEIRQIVQYATIEERQAYQSLVDVLDEYNNAEQDIKNSRQMIEKLEIASKDLRNIIDTDDEHPLNLASPAQVSTLFYDILQIPNPGDKKSVAKRELKALIKEKNSDGSPKYPIVHLYSEYKKQDTLVTKFFDNLQYFMYPGGYIFSHFGQIAAATGRMSASKPNPQQYPHSVTKMVKPRPGYSMIDADYSQIEYRVLTALAKNEWLAELFSDPDSDYHTLMASLMFDVPYANVTGDMRKQAKSFNFGIPYGMGFASLAILLTGNSLPASIEEAKVKYELYFKNQPKTRKFFDTVKEQAQVNRYTQTFWHRRRYYSFEDKDGKTNHAKKAAALRQAGNAVIQGCERGDTLIQTKEHGIVQVQDVVDKHLHVWDGEKWSEGDILYSGKKRKCIITFTNGQQFVCSPIHKFLVKSHKGNERFVECQDLLTKENAKNPHRIVITRGYEPSDWVYNSQEARLKYMGFTNNDKNVFLDDIGDSFKAGVVLGRLASDGNIANTKNSRVIRQIIAEHEMSVYDVLKDYMKPLGTTEYHTGIREGRTQDIVQLKVHSASLVNEISDLNIKRQIPKEVFKDTEMLRGFLRGMFDGDGGISGKTITLVFGTQADFEPMCRQIQKALLFFGIRSRYYKYDYRYKITIKTNDNQKFLDMIGFINPEKQEKGRSLEYVRDEHIFGQVLIPEKVEITDEYIDMYDVCNTDGGYYVADGIITHNTAADVFKISVARNFQFIRENHLLGKLLIINMVHDEQLFEVDTRYLNIEKVLACIGRNMQFKVDGFPPLFIGAGVGESWDEAKSKDAEIHPTLLENITKESDAYNIWVNNPMKLDDSNMKFKYDFSTGSDNIAERKSPEEWLQLFKQKNLQFRIDKVKAYLMDEKNKGQIIAPVIGSLLNLNFSYGHSKKEGLTDDQLTKKCLEEFILHNGLAGICNPSDYLTQEEDNALKNIVTTNASSVGQEDEDEESGYDDTDDDESFIDIDEDADFYGGDFIQIDESDKTYGCTVQDLIQTFGNFVSKSKRICGIDTRSLTQTKLDAIIDYLYEHICNENDAGAMEIMFLQSCNILKKTGVYVKNIEGSEVEKRLRLAKAKYDFDERVQ